jgi:uncharacterized protein (TIGR02598 family)
MYFSRLAKNNRKFSLPRCIYPVNTPASNRLNKTPLPMKKVNTSAISFPERFPNSQATGAFSLVEVALSISIIAIAFTVLIGMLPAGMRTFQEANDVSNESRITANMVGILQSSEFEEMKSPSFSNTLYFFDAEGTFVDSQIGGAGGSSINEPQRIYMGRLLTEEQNIPMGVDANKSGEKYSKNIALKGLLLISRYGLAGEKGLSRRELFLTVTYADIADPSTMDPSKKSLKFKTMPITVAKMDGVKN